MCKLTFPQACAESVIYTKNVEGADPCRFCGYVDGLFYCEDISPIVTEDDRPGCYILCLRCGARGPIDSVRNTTVGARKDSIEWAIRMWNQGIEV